VAENLSQVTATATDRHVLVQDKADRVQVHCTHHHASGTVRGHALVTAQENALGTVSRNVHGEVRNTASGPVQGIASPGRACDHHVLVGQETATGRAGQR
jgi:hypothetical protein